MDYIVLSFDISPIAVGLFALGILAGIGIKRHIYHAVSFLSVLFSINSSRYLLGQPTDWTTFLSYLATFFMVGLAFGNYLELRNKEVKEMLASIQLQLAKIEKNEG